MTRLLRRFVLWPTLPLLSAGLLLVLPAAAQSAPSTPPAEGAPGQSAGPARRVFKPKNLKVLPENTDIIKVMRGFEAALGVECEYCHTAADPVTHRGDRASDANPMKDQARVMIQMTDDLNKKYLPLLAKLPGEDGDRTVIGCGTCHRGEKHPPAFVAPPRPEGQRGPGRPTIAPPGNAPATPQ